MGTLPSPREARQFLSRFTLPAPVQKTSLTSSTHLAVSGTDSSPSSNKTFVDSLLWPTDHVALIKLEGPFEHDNLIAIANTLVQLQRLGLMSVVMLDNQTWWRHQSPHLNDALVSGSDQSAEIRRRMMNDMADVVEEIERSGGRARPIYDGVFEDAKTSPQQSHVISERIVVADTAVDHVLIRPGSRIIESCLKLRQIPVMIPMATTAHSHRLPVQSNKALVALAKYMGSTVNEASQGAGHGSLVPMRLIVINTSGGFPLTRAKGISGPTHCFVNLKDEYDAITDDLANMNHIPEELAKSYRSDLDMIRDCLAYLPPSCSALVTSSPSLTLITNLITDKPLFSSTMRGQDPKVMLATTVLRNGLDIFTFQNNLQGMDLKRLQSLLETSFGKSLDADGFYARIQDRIEAVILAGEDYMGAAIVTREGGDVSGKGEKTETHTLASVAYLDKFSVAPKSQGIGVADILWKKLTDQFPDLVWRSRSDNPVNKWYFDRADGHIKIPGTNWTVFWYGPKGLGLMSDYIEICRGIPASFLPKPLLEIQK
ncbi:hypothetical protein BCR41DRAFT_328592 [Lobosporangium transversale]|uniref:Amino-acid acetyltransferase, mitochondrial n=1 Tax=Lobosporangium transversale TaxID=64571 RepID=A0A1Y2GA39_9FUNG|nr:hypothetical protein BCR41DRAFT_328592 [Lobosporangium transversale]ORZ04077.1 hypothetical protein BCR41DRAFT_328592 [Lobosporangium transversale]|eukprot:XP_021876354.1 hypothetical protein BCR41DRAFT_328592 [Lobosporangium transversale]